MNLTKKERAAIRALEKVAKIWPDSLWLLSSSGSLWVMKKKDGKRVMGESGIYNSDYVMTDIYIENDGGDW